MMDIKIVTEFLDNLDKIEKYIYEEEFELMTETVQKNESVLRKLQNLRNELPESQWGELEVIKPKLIKRQGEVIKKLQNLTTEKKPQFKEMSQKVQASQAYNKMKRGY